MKKQVPLIIVIILSIVMITQHQKQEGFYAMNPGECGLNNTACVTCVNQPHYCSEGREMYHGFNLMTSNCTSGGGDFVWAFCPGQCTGNSCSNTNPICNDLDYGVDDAVTASSIVGQYSINNTFSIADECYDSKHVTEQVCRGSYPSNLIIDCDTIFLGSGACVGNKCVQSGCQCSSGACCHNNCQIVPEEGIMGDIPTGPINCGNLTCSQFDTECKKYQDVEVPIYCDGIHAECITTNSQTCNQYVITPYVANGVPCAGGTKECKDGLCVAKSIDCDSASGLRAQAGQAITAWAVAAQPATTLRATAGSKIQAWASQC